MWYIQVEMSFGQFINVPDEAYYSVGVAETRMIELRQKNRSKRYRVQFYLPD